MKHEATKPHNRPEIENLVLTYFPSCPFCKHKAMQFTWGELVPKRMVCQNCSASWEPYMSYDAHAHALEWTFMSATLVRLGKEGKGANLLNKMYPANFWKEMSTPISGSEKKLESSQALGESSRVVIIREVVKIRCQYCGGLFDEIHGRCPYCGGKR